MLRFTWGAFLLFLFFAYQLDGKAFLHPASHCQDANRPRSPDAKKVMVVGLPKSGTTSMGEFFWYLCLTVRKHEHELERANGDFANFTTFKYFDAITNSLEWYYADIEEARPGEFIFVVVKRSVESWLHSARKHFCFDEWKFSDSNFQSFGVRTYNDGHFRRVHERFYREIELYFKDRWDKDAFLVEPEELGKDPALEQATIKKLAKAAGVHPDTLLPPEFPHRNHRHKICQFSQSRVAKMNISYVDPTCIETCTIKEERTQRV